MISERLKKVIMRQLTLDDIELNDDTRAYQVPGWDSLHHVIVLSAIEREFGIRFTTAEVVRLQNLGELQSLIQRKADAL